MKKRIIACILSALCFFAVGCRGNSGDNGTGEEREKYRYTEGVHQLTATETTDYMVQNGKSEYKILLPNQADGNLFVAESELKYFFEEEYSIESFRDLEQAMQDAKQLDEEDVRKFLEFSKGCILVAHNAIFDVSFIKEAINKCLPKRIVYVSCNPASLAKDLAELTEKYQVKYIQPIDMFPFTSHVESVTMLELKKPQK